ncbi:MAG: tRNA 2-thiouridine(34) synthase MnmA [Omnitrophica WOR_2 bacterium RIFCSPHIGHO2_01_FULL_48_9]|nr:MAG: tRNA 2-thiouridine(34) synthase MnmA [Omnitrophica WOR_2 bacterium RIFCSPHIGHO2_02_FULL_48_11]OGX30008.1 MAG: tRNA 2-thiouridine(34) synthase MnmA [Omnitrophica WOR_2 bacterium RIFCSPHIGHO2_01_FULL_48_9]
MDKKLTTKKKVFVAMSGGVDSSVVAGLMKEAGHDVVGVTMCFSISHPESKKPSCCGVDGIQDAKRAAQILDIPHYVLDFAKDINDHIIDNFTSEYLSGRTPNPCVQCNQHLKFGSLYHKVMGMGADALATGHYGKIEYHEKTRNYQLKKAKDTRKDQSYFLYSMKRETLPRVLFPLGNMTKQEVREQARCFGLDAVAEKPESQDICFVPDGGYQKFLENRLGKEIFQPGPYKNEKGEVVGEHKGIAYYTIGQRERLGIALGKPVYVYKIEKETNTVYVGPESMLYSSGLVASNFNPVSIDVPTQPLDISVRIRYNAPEVSGTLTYLENGRVSVIFQEPQKSVTPGQSVVFYDGDVVLAGATIDEPIQ